MKWLPVFLFCLGQASGLPFSHELHLKLKLECVRCHAAAPASTRASDNLLPKKEACAGCHREIPLRSQPSPSVVSRFDHRKHLSFGSVAPVLKAAVKSGAYLSPPGDIERHLSSTAACEACHRGLGESKEISAANFPRMADCLVCHNKIDPPWSCEFCHDKTVKIRPATHTADFLDLHNKRVNALGRETCAVCHGRKFTCLGCH